MKKLLKLLSVFVLTLTLASCSSTKTEEDVNVEETIKETVVVNVVNGNKEFIDVEFPKNPERIAVLNYQTLDFLDNMGLGDKVVGVIDVSNGPDHLKHYKDKEGVTILGGMKDIDMEALMELEPDVIFSSDRTQAMYDEFSMIAPTMAAYINYSNGFMNSYEELANNHAKIFGVEDKFKSLIDGYNERIKTINEFADGKTALLGLFTGDAINTLGDSGRANIITNEMGFTNLAGDENVNHGNISSYEAWLELNPDYMFILDKDAAVGTEATAAKELMEINNAVIAETNAFKNGNIIYLNPGAAWYLADGGLTSLDLMITCIEEGLKIK